jgi:cytochrome P450
MLSSTYAVAGKPLAPGPREWPVVGNVGVLRGLLPFLEDAWQEHGDVFRVRMGSHRLLVLARPEHLHHVLVTHRHNYVKGAMYDATRTIAGDGLATLEGDAWKERRTLAQPAFHRQSLEKLTAIMVDTGARYFDALARRVGTSGSELDMHQELVRLTLDVVIETLLGSGTLESGQVSYRALGEALEVMNLSASSAVQLPEWVPTPHNIKLRRTLRALNENVYQIIRVARERDTDGTLLSMLLAARDVHGQALTDQDLRNEVITLFLAGHETTALTLTWFFVLMEKNPEVLARMRDEVDEVLAGREPSFADLPKLVYTRQVIDEVLRLRPPASMLGRNAVTEDAIGGFHVGPGQGVLLFLWAAHRHPDHWEDPLRFSPDRFTPAANKARHMCSYLPFSAGPRSCIGNSFALFEAQVLLAQLISRFDFQFEDCSDVKPVVLTTTRPSKPVRVRLVPRRRNETVQGALMTTTTSTR